MTTVIEGLLACDDVEPVTVDSFDRYLDADWRGLTALFFTGDVAKRPESADVAVVLRELLKQYKGVLRVGVVDRKSEPRLIRQAHAVMLPSLSFFAGRAHLETIPKIQDWAVYAQKLPELMARAGHRTAA